MVVYETRSMAACDVLLPLKSDFLRIGFNIYLEDHPN